ncbi:hypothetical protein ACP26L_11010 [Paenibacillus sp. S-38]|uniref:hypothetical protein n=1 Tax=Paenibacillus sp. S-38 TaxID=3416710 RepID=UPI003CF75120
MSLSEFDLFIAKGNYQKLKYTEKKIELIKELIRDALKSQEVKCETWPEYGVVGKFKTVFRYKYDHENINRFLYELGILSISASIKEQFLDYEEIAT